MSSRASVVIRLEVPPRLLAERVSDGLAVLAMLTVGWVTVRHAPAALCVALSAFVALALWLGGQRVGGSGTWVVVPGPGTRTLGRTVILRARPAVPGHPAAHRLWLTPADLPAVALRRLAVRLPAASRNAAS
jgi:hypothetical protein